MLRVPLSHRLAVTALLGAFVLSIILPVPAAAQDASKRAAKSAQQLHIERIIAKIEPELRGNPKRLDVYIEFFKRELINDARLFPVDIHARRDADGSIELSGYVGYVEQHKTLLAVLGYLGFDDIDDRIEVLPSKDLAKKSFGFIAVPHSFTFARAAADNKGGSPGTQTDCLLGSAVYLLKPCAHGYFLCHSDEGYVSYIDGRNILRVDAAEFKRYQSGPQVFIQRDYRQGQVLLPIGARLKWVADGPKSVVVETPDGGRIAVPNDYCRVHQPGPVPRVQRALEAAQRLLGTDYVWGGKTSEGVDCSGLVQTAFRAQGVNFARDASQQVYLGALTATRWYRDGLQAGDTLYFLGRYGKISHTGIYLGDGQYIESIRPHARLSSFNPEDKNYSAHGDASFCFGKRLLE